jgi:hypothetical protein
VFSLAGKMSHIRSLVNKANQKVVGQGSSSRKGSLVDAVKLGFDRAVALLKVVNPDVDLSVEGIHPLNDVNDRAIIPPPDLEKLEPSKPSSSFAWDDNTRLLGQAEILSDQPKVASPRPATDPQSRTIVVSSISESAEINSRSETESSIKASADISLGEGIVGDKISASADHD